MAYPIPQINFNRYIEIPITLVTGPYFPRSIYQQALPSYILYSPFVTNVPTGYWSIGIYDESNNLIEYLPPEIAPGSRILLTVPDVSSNAPPPPPPGGPVAVIVVPATPEYNIVIINENNEIAYVRNINSFQDYGNFWLTFNLILRNIPLPTAPTNLTATAISDTEIELTWDQVEFAETYIIEKLNDLEEWYVYDQISATQTTYIDTGLEPNETYSYRILASNNTGLSDPSNEASATTTSEFQWIWNININGDGSVTQTGTTFSFVGPNDGGGNGWSYITAQAPNENGTLSIEYVWFTPDGISFDWPFYSVTINPFQGLTTPAFQPARASSNSQQGAWNIDYNANEYITIGVYSTDSVAGAGFLTLTSVPGTLA
jgi:hypothetical protein